VPLSLPDRLTERDRPSVTEQPLAHADTPIMRRTLARRVSLRGRTLHGGQRIRLTLHPAEADSGIRFRRTGRRGRDAEIPALWTHAVDSILCTALRAENGVEIRTVEHLLFALAVGGVDDALIELDGDEVPILDGSAAPFLALLCEAGTAETGRPRRFIELRRPISFAWKRSRFALEPHDGLALDITLPLLIGPQRWAGAGDADTLRREIAPARTFGQIGRALPAKVLSWLGGPRILRGASLSCALVYHKDRVLNREGMRLPDEPVRHRVLDFIGDLALAGAPLRARIVGEGPSHAANRRLVAALHARPDAWRWTECCRDAAA